MDAQRQRVRRAETDLQGERDDLGPAAGVGGHVTDVDAVPLAVAVQAGHLVRPELEQFEETGLVVGDRERAQVASGGDDHDADRVGAGDLDAALCRPVHEHDGVDVVGEGVGRPDERLGELLFPAHERSPSLPWSSSRPSGSGRKRSLRARTSRATWLTVRPSAKARARIRSRACSGSTSICTITMPTAW